MTKEEADAIRSLRERGYAVAVLNPDDIRGIDPVEIQDLMIKEADDAVRLLAPMPRAAIFRNVGNGE